MAFCTNCGSQIPDGSAACPICGSVINAPAEQPAQQAAAAPQQQNPYPQQPPYQQPQQQNPYAQQNSYQQPYVQAPVNPQQQELFYNTAKSAKTMGILAIVFAFIIPIATAIFAKLGLDKAKQVIDYANAYSDAALRGEGERAKRLCIAGIIIAAVFLILALISSIGNSLSNSLIAF